MSIEQFLLERPWNRPELAPSAVLNAPGFISPGESALLYFLARDYYTGAGAILDLGCFLGRSTVALAQGLLDNPRVERKAGRIRSYDKFSVSSSELYMANLIGQTAHGGAAAMVRPDGLWFRPIFNQTTAPYREWLTVHEGEFPPLPYDGAPVEILFIDIAKTEALNNAIVEVMFPRLIPGRSIVVQQDFHHLFGWNIHFCMDFFADHFRIVIDAVGASCVFLLVEEIPTDKITAFAKGSVRHTLESGIEALTRMQGLLFAPYRCYLELTKARWKMHFGVDVTDDAQRLRSLPMVAGDLDGPWNRWIDLLLEEARTYAPATGHG